jgi:hypothetical protein
VRISELVFGTLTHEPSLGIAAIAGPPYIVIVHDTYKLLKSRSGTPKVVAHQAGTQSCSVPPSICKINSKGTAALNAQRASFIALLRAVSLARLGVAFSKATI